LIFGLFSVAPPPGKFSADCVHSAVPLAKVGLLLDSKTLGPYAVARCIVNIVLPALLHCCAVLACLHDQNKSGFFGEPAFFPANQSNLKILKKL